MSRHPKSIRLSAAAEILGLSTRQVLRLVESGQLPVRHGYRRVLWFSLARVETLKKRRDEAAAAPLPPPPADYISTRELLERRRKLRKEGYPAPATVNTLIRVLRAAAVPECKRPIATSPTPSNYWQEDAAMSAILAARIRESRGSAHPIAPPEILNSKKWVTAARAAKIIGCSTADISARAAKYNLKAYTHPQTKKILVNWIEAKESLRWRNSRFIINHFGLGVFQLVKKYAPSRTVAVDFCRFSLYYVPELISGNRSGGL